MKKRNYAGSNAVDTLITITNILMYLCFPVALVLGVLGFESFFDDSLIGVAIGVAGLGITLLITKLFLKGFESIVIASDMYIEQMEIEKEKCAKNVHEEA